MHWWSAVCPAWIAWPATRATTSCTGASSRRVRRKAPATASRAGATAGWTVSAAAATTRCSEAQDDSLDGDRLRRQLRVQGHGVRRRHRRHLDRVRRPSVGKSNAIAGLEELVDPSWLRTDSINASAGPGRYVIFGDDGEDTMIGGAQADFLEGGEGDDRIEGRGGDDTLSGGVGDNALFGRHGEGSSDSGRRRRRTERRRR